MKWLARIIVHVRLSAMLSCVKFMMTFCLLQYELTLFHVMNLIQIVRFAEVLYQVVSDDWPSVIFQRFVIPHQVKRLFTFQDFCRMKTFAVRHPIGLATFPFAIMPYLSHEAKRLLKSAFLLVPWHQLQRKSSMTTVAKILARKLKFSAQSLEGERADRSQLVVTYWTVFQWNSTKSTNWMTTDA